ncbi:MAG: glycoside hydrolase family 13 protein [Beduini sp.]|uniref:glycoside hydrolase family 13 protein n=2 Tax=Beduini sp. TaxID=1922300 RepID=UPI0011CBE233
MKQTWWKESVIYQVYPRSFKDSNHDGIGDINGIREKLDYLADLGVDVVWLSPIYASPNEDNGYDISDYQAIMKEFGTMEDFDALLNEAHQKGLKIVMDLVVNHTSDEHQWFIESRKSKDNPYRDYYIWKEGNQDHYPNNWGSVFSGPAWQYDEATNMYYLHLFAKKQPDLNWENKAMRQSVYDMMTWWLDKGIDGFRMDVINMISKDQSFPDGEKNGGLYGNCSPYTVNGPRVHEYLKEMNKEVLSKYDILTVGETPGVSVKDAMGYTGEDEHELNMVFQFELMDIDLGQYGKWTPVPFDLCKLKAVMKKWQTGLENKGWNSLYWNNHDQPRVVSRFGNDHEYHIKSAKMLAMCLHMHQGTPYIYQGEELGMSNVRFDSIHDYKDIEILNAYKELVEDKKVLSEQEFMKGVYSHSRDNARTPMQWDDSAYAGFSEVQPWIAVNPNYTSINAKSQVNDPDSVYSFYKQLLTLRKQYKIMVYGHYEILDEENPNTYMYTRTLEQQQLLVLCNFTDQKQTVEIPNDLLKEAKVFITNDIEKPLEKIMTLNPYESVTYIL